MKGFCYIVLFGAFIMSYYKSPMYCLVIVGIVILFFLFTRFRRSSSNGSAPRGFIFRKGVISQNNNQVNDLATLFMVQQMFKDSGDQDEYGRDDSKDDGKNDKIDTIKNEILDLLLED